MTQEQEERLDATKLEKVPFIAEDIYNKSMTQPNWEDRYQEIWAHIDTPENWSWIKLEIKDLIQKSIQQAREEVVTDLLDLCGELPIRIGMPRHLLVIDLHNYAKEKGISITPNKTYAQHYSHTHCWNQHPPACGINIENHKQCCLCDLTPNTEIQ